MLDDYSRYIIAWKLIFDRWFPPSGWRIHDWGNADRVKAPGEGVQQRKLRPCNCQVSGHTFLTPYRCERSLNLSSPSKDGIK
jgi:hypothetical protein